MTGFVGLFAFGNLAPLKLLLLLLLLASHARVSPVLGKVRDERDKFARPPPSRACFLFCSGGCHSNSLSPHTPSREHEKVHHRLSCCGKFPLIESHGQPGLAVLAGPRVQCGCQRRRRSHEREVSTKITDKKNERRKETFRTLLFWLLLCRHCALSLNPFIVSTFARCRCAVSSQPVDHIQRAWTSLR